MPPPNHQIGSASAFCATKKRTLRCTVGAYGLRGCSTSDTPIASHARPASSGRCAVADAGRRSPRTCENSTPPRSSTLPCSTSREMPPPPSGRVHSSRRNGERSIASRPATMSSCRPVRYSRTAGASIVVTGGPSPATLSPHAGRGTIRRDARALRSLSPARGEGWGEGRPHSFARDGAMADVGAELHAGEPDLADRGVGGALRQPHRVAERGDAQHAAAADHRVAADLARCPRGRRGRPGAPPPSRGRGLRSTSPLRGASG